MFRLFLDGVPYEQTPYTNNALSSRYDDMELDGAGMGYSTTLSQATRSAVNRAASLAALHGTKIIATPIEGQAADPRTQRSGLTLMEKTRQTLAWRLSLAVKEPEHMHTPFTLGSIITGEYTDPSGIRVTAELLAQSEKVALSQEGATVANITARHTDGAQPTRRGPTPIFDLVYTLRAGGRSTVRGYFDDIREDAARFTDGIWDTLGLEQLGPSPGEVSMSLRPQVHPDGGPTLKILWEQIGPTQVNRAAEFVVRTAQGDSPLQ